MGELVIIDGNNLLHAMHAHAPLPNVGREKLVRIVEEWARSGDDEVTLVFDGPEPRGGLAKQMASKRVGVRFSAPATADDVIVDLIQRVKDPGRVRVVTGDKAIRREAVYKRCRHVEAVAFVAELFPRNDQPKLVQPDRHEKPDSPTGEESHDWLETFGFDKNDDEPFDGADAMME